VIELPLVIVALVAEIRRRAPRVDGAVVLVVALVVGVLVSMAIAYDAGEPLGQGAVRGALAALAAVGGMTALDRVKPAQEVPSDPR
jgi:ABC-type transport system involved in cytochrome bd biosynthesis fused ATPase/permease subunit